MRVHTVITPGSSRLPYPLTADTQPDDLEERCGTTFDSDMTVLELKDHLVVGGLVYDADAEDPTHMDGEGSIHFRRDGAGQQAWLEAQGLTAEGEPNFGSGAVAEILNKQVWATVRQDKSLRMTLRHLLRRYGQAHGDTFSVQAALAAAVEQGGDEDSLAYAFTGQYRAYHLPEGDQARLAPLARLLAENRMAAWRQVRDQGQVGDVLAVMLDVYEHGGMVLSVSGEGMQCPWDTARGGAVWVPDAIASEEIRARVKQKHAQGEAASLQDEAADYCRSVLSAYNDWLAGDSHGVCAYVLDKETGQLLDHYTSEVWGYVGGQYAREELASVMKSIVCQLGGSDD